MIGIDKKCVVTITQAHLRLPTISVWTLKWRRKGVDSTEPYLRHSWSSDFDKLINMKGQIRQDSFCVDYIFSNTRNNKAIEAEEGKPQIMFLLSDATVVLIDVQSKSCIMQENLKALFKVHDEDQEDQTIINISQHPTHGFKHVIFAVGCKCYALNCPYVMALSASSLSPAHKNYDINNTLFDSVIEIVDGVREGVDRINHVSFSKNGKYLSCCTTICGDVYVYNVQQNSNGSLSYHLLYKLPAVLSPHLQHSPFLCALASDFSWTSEELLVAYSSSEMRVWQLPRSMSLKEITRNAICKFVPEEIINELHLPKDLKNYLHFVVA